LQKLPNLDLWINKNEEHMVTKTITNKFENHLLSIIDERQKMIHPKSHPTYNERHQKIIELIDWTLDKYKEAVTAANIKQTNHNNEEAIITDNIIEELDKKRDIAINNKKEALLREEVWKYGEEEDAIDYILFIIREGTGILY
jgi:hypothetical protein